MRRAACVQQTKATRQRPTRTCTSRLGKASDRRLGKWPSRRNKMNERDCTYAMSTTLRSGMGKVGLKSFGRGGNVFEEGKKREGRVLSRIASREFFFLGPCYSGCFCSNFFSPCRQVPCLVGGLEENDKQIRHPSPASLPKAVIYWAGVTLKALTDDAALCYRNWCITGY